MNGRKKPHKMFNFLFVVRRAKIISEGSLACRPL